MREPGNEVAVQLAKKSLLSCLLPLSQNKSSWLWNHPYENVFSNTPQVHFHADRTHFWHERFCLRTRFETEVQGNLEMAYWIDNTYITCFNNTRFLSTQIFDVKFGFHCCFALKKIFCSFSFGLTFHILESQCHLHLIMYSCGSI